VRIGVGQQAKQFGRIALYERRDGWFTDGAGTSRSDFDEPGTAEGAPGTERVRVSVLA
jgi:hypothetical protein